MPAPAVTPNTPATQPPPPPADGKVTAASLVGRIADLFKAIDALLTDKSIADVILLIKKLGIQGAVTTGCNALASGLDSFKNWLETIKEPLDQTESLAGLIGLMQPLVRGVGRLATASLEELRSLGLGELDKAIGPAKTVVAIGDRLIGAGRDVIAGLPHSKDITDLQTSLAGVVKALANFKTELAKPLPPPPPKGQQGALPTGGLL